MKDGCAAWCWELASTLMTGPSRQIPAAAFPRAARHTCSRRHHRKKNCETPQGLASIALSSISATGALAAAASAAATAAPAAATAAARDEDYDDDDPKASAITTSEHIYFPFSAQFFSQTSPVRGADVHLSRTKARTASFSFRPILCLPLSSGY